MTTQPTLGDEFETLQAKAKQAFEDGRTEDSYHLYQEALEWARSCGDRRRSDLALCNVAGIRMLLNHREPLDTSTTNHLREILVRNDDNTNSFLAAYNLARAFELTKDTRKGLFYARIALDRALLADRAAWMASSHNQIGNFLVAQSFFDQATTEYEEALSLVPANGFDERRMIFLINLGYASLVVGKLDRGMKLLYSTLRTLRHQGMKRGQMLAHIDLCYAHLEAERYGDALRNGSRGLLLAEELGEADSLKNALYLLGQTHNLRGDSELARSYFSRLQHEFYPQTGGIADFLLMVDVRKMINLRA